jgi:hypothetical protein
MPYMRNVFAIIISMVAIQTSSAAVASESKFERHQNAEAEASIERVAALQTKEFEKARNREIDIALAAYNEASFESERNLEIDASIERVTRARTLEFAEEMNARVDGDFARARNAEIDASMAAVDANRQQKAFDQARNTEIERSVALLQARRMPLETGSIAPAQACGASSKLQTFEIAIDEVTWASPSPVCHKYSPMTAGLVETPCE